MQTLKDFKNYLPGSTVFVVGSGFSLHWLKGLRLNDFIVIGVNRIAPFFPCDFVIVHHHESIPEIQQNGDYDHLFVSRYPQCVIDGEAPNHEGKDYIVYDHCNQGYHRTDFSPLKPSFQAAHPNHILTGGNTVINAIGLAVYMGAKNIILAGCDGGAINGNSNIEGYHPETDLSKIYQTGHSLRSLALNMEIRTELKKHGISLMTLSPFLDYNLEGNSFTSFRPVPGEEYFHALYQKHRLK